MTHVPYDRPQDAPRTTKAADGKTRLYRFNVEGVIYARSKAEAEKNLGYANIVLDHARIVPAVVTAEVEMP